MTFGTVTCQVTGEQAMKTGLLRNLGRQILMAGKTGIRHLVGIGTMTSDAVARFEKPRDPGMGRRNQTG
jgi:hypothetical protein